MAYSHTTFAQLKTRLSQRLGDEAKVFWVDVELGLYIIEALRMWGALTGYWREKGTFSTVQGTAFYDLGPLLTNGSDLLLSRTVTDRNTIQLMQYHLLEAATSQSVWNGTDMFTLDDLRFFLQYHRNQFLFDTGIVLTRSTLNMPPPPIGRVQLVDTIIDVRRVNWIDDSLANHVLWREDEYNFTAFASTWDSDPGTPTVYSVAAVKPLEIQVNPLPIVSGTMELIAIQTGADLDPATSATALGIPDDICWTVKWGALADLLSAPGQAYDPFRAAIAKQMYELGVLAAKNLPVVITAQINGIATSPCAMQDIDSYQGTGWQDTQTTPSIVGTAQNMVIISGMPNGIYSIGLDVVRKAPIPSLDTDLIQIGREYLDTILDMAQWLAAFKQGGSDITAIQPLFHSFMTEAKRYNAHLNAAVRDWSIMSGQSQREESYVKRELTLAGG